MNPNNVTISNIKTIMAEIADGERPCGVDITDPEKPVVIPEDIPKTEFQQANDQIAQLNEYLFEMEYRQSKTELGL